MWGQLLMAAGAALGDSWPMLRKISRLLRPARHLRGPRQAIRNRLINCWICGSEFVNPVFWHERDETHWWIRLRCGECGAVREVVVSNEDAKRFDDDLDRGVAKIGATVARLDRARRELNDRSDFCR
jgi:hypothetical protein